MGPAAAFVIMTKEENVQEQEKGTHEDEEQEEARVQREEELTEEEEEEEEYELEEEKSKVENEEEGEQEGEREEHEEQQGQEDPPVEPETEMISVSEHQSPVHEPPRRAMVHPSAQAPLPKDYGMFYRLKYAFEECTVSIPLWKDMVYLKTFLDLSFFSNWMNIN